MMLDYMDDRTAIHYLSTCQSLHGGYHHYPLKQAMSVAAFRESTQVDEYMDGVWGGKQMWVSLAVLVLEIALLVAIGVTTSERVRINLTYALSSLGLLNSCRLLWKLCTRRVDCCAERRWGAWRRRYRMPRVTRLSGGLWDMRLLPYLQHLTELATEYDKDRPFGKKYPLPATLRTLRLLDSPDLELTADTLPPGLTSLTLGAVKNRPPLVGALPQSLTSLCLTHGFQAEMLIGVDVLPSNLQRLELCHWTWPLSNIVLPASLSELQIHKLADHPLPVLPSQLRVLCLGGPFQQPLTGVLPSSLRVLRLTGFFSQPLTADMFAGTPQLEELYLSDHSPARQLAMKVLPRSLRVLRLGELCTLVTYESSDVPPQLRRVIAPAGWDVVRVRRAQLVGKARGFTVEQEAAPEQPIQA